MITRKQLAEGSRLTHTIEGVPLDVPFVVGRRRVGEGDKGLVGEEGEWGVGRGFSNFIPNWSPLFLN